MVDKDIIPKLLTNNQQEMYTIKQLNFNEYSELTDFIKENDKKNLKFLQVVDVFKSGNAEKIHTAAILFKDASKEETKFILISKSGGGFMRAYVNTHKDKAIEMFCERSGFDIKDFIKRGCTVKELTVQRDFLTYGIRK